MKAISMAAAAVAFGCLAAGACAAPKAASVAVASIVDSGSVQTAPFTVRVDARGQATMKGRKAILSKSQAKKFFADIHEAQVNPRPSGGAMCFKTPAGTALRVHMGAWQSVDLHCPVVGANAALRDDVAAILQSINPVTPGRRVNLPVNEPRRVEGSPAPSPSTRP